MDPLLTFVHDPGAEGLVASGRVLDRWLEREVAVLRRVEALLP